MNQSNEIWKPVVGYEGFYEVSNQGRVRTVARKTVRSNGRPTTINSKIRKLSVNHKGYLKLGLIKDNVNVTRTVHTLVLEAFGGPKPNPHYVTRHLNGNPTDNRPENLAWGTPRENMLDRIKHGNDPNASKTHCIRGHKFSGKNLFVTSDNRRACRSCKQEFKRSYEQKRGFDPAKADARYLRYVSTE